jgi:Immunity protein 26
MFELSNYQRRYFGLPEISPKWDKVLLKGDQYRPESILYFDDETITRHIISTETEYVERQYGERTRNRVFLLSKTGKAEGKKLTASVLESRRPIGMHCRIDSRGRIYIGSYATKTTFFDSGWPRSINIADSDINTHVAKFISTVPSNYLEELDFFSKEKRKNIKYKAGDFFRFKLNLTEYGFGRVLLDIYQLKKKSVIDIDHGLGFLMWRPVLVKLYAFISKSKEVSIELLENAISLPSDYIFDNLLFYGEFEIIGNKNLIEKDFDFPMSYGKHISSTKNCVFFQWGAIHIEMPFEKFNKYLNGINPLLPENHKSREVRNPFGYYGVGLYPHFTEWDIKGAIENNGFFNSDPSSYSAIFDLRNPKNRGIRNEIMEAFKLEPDKGYEENRLLTKSPNLLEYL